MEGGGADSRSGVRKVNLTKKADITKAETKEAGNLAVFDETPSFSSSSPSSSTPHIFLDVLVVGLRRRRRSKSSSSSPSFLHLVSSLTPTPCVSPSPPSPPTLVQNLVESAPA